MGARNRKNSFNCHGRDTHGQRDKRIRARKRRERWRQCRRFEWWQCRHERGHEWGRERKRDRRCPSFGDARHQHHCHSRQPLPINDAYSAVQR